MTLCDFYEWSVRLNTLCSISYRQLLGQQTLRWLNVDVTMSAAGTFKQALTFQRECEQQPAAVCSSSSHLHLFLL